MVSKRLIKKIIESANVEDLRTFAEIAVEHLLNDYDADIKVPNALDIISGVANPYEATHIDNAKVIEYLRKYAYNAENVEKFRIGSIDNFDATLRVYYKCNPDDEYEQSYSIKLEDVAIKED